MRGRQENRYQFKKSALQQSPLGLPTLPELLVIVVKTLPVVAELLQAGLVEVVDSARATANALAFLQSWPACIGPCPKLGFHAAPEANAFQPRPRSQLPAESTVTSPPWPRPLSNYDEGMRTPTRLLRTVSPSGPLACIHTRPAHTPASCSACSHRCRLGTAPR